MDAAKQWREEQERLDRAEALEQAIAVRREVLTITEYFPSRKDAPDA
jgi:hypothetical protein